MLWCLFLFNGAVAAVCYVTLDGVKGIMAAVGMGLVSLGAAGGLAVQAAGRSRSRRSTSPGLTGRPTASAAPSPSHARIPLKDPPMAADRRRGRRVATLATTLAAIALTAGLATGCDGVDNSLDCLQYADTIADSLGGHQRGRPGRGEGHPTRTDKSIETINKNLDRIGTRRATARSTGRSTSSTRPSSTTTRPS